MLLHMTLSSREDILIKAFTINGRDSHLDSTILHVKFQDHRPFVCEEDFKSLP